MTATVLGLYSASSNFPSLWCEVKKDELSIIGGNKPRSSETHLQIINRPKKKSNSHLGYKCKPIISEIPYSNYIIDLLHLFLRVSDVLFEFLISELFGLDKFGVSSVFDEDKHLNLSKLFNFVKSECDISLKIFKNKEKSINSIMNSLPATSRLKIFEKINIYDLYKEDKLINSKGINCIWKTFYKIYSCLKGLNVPVPEQI
ncbi:hypothetical protein BpHYR1_042696 [Brachionus plicatilis]|uniref:Uncharacterized protein n=1 Tax=Brachionus plicatilis TaxID=10195 RepID=A0A3M7SAL9_BRAPC|nr:hypothetical protein BpHYR1_042696 [Brachionus plicatilis]